MLLCILKIFLCCVNGWIFGIVVNDIWRKRQAKLLINIIITAWSIANALGFALFVWG